MDGETDLKRRIVPLPCIGLTIELLHRIKVRLFISHNRNIPEKNRHNDTFCEVKFLHFIDIKIGNVLQGLIECPVPNNDIRRFDGNLRLFPPFIENDLFSLTINNTLLQGCYLRNTEWACGVAVYTGNLMSFDYGILFIYLSEFDLCLCSHNSCINFWNVFKYMLVINRKHVLININILSEWIGLGIEQIKTLLLGSQFTFWFTLLIVYVKHLQKERDRNV